MDEDEASKDVQRLLEGINASMAVRHPRRALLKQDGYKVICMGQVTGGG